MGYSDTAAKMANEIIASLDLPLVAIPSSFPAKDSFTVQSNQIDAL